MRRVATLAETRAADAAAVAGVGEDVLVARAAGAVAVRAAGLVGRVYGARITLLAGTGHNGADALFAGARLAARGAVVSAVLVGDSEPDALGLRARAELVGAGGRIVADLPVSSDLVIDGMAGLGAKGALRPRAASLAEAVRERLTLAVDLPSGVDTDTGAVEGVAVRADVTVTFDALKPGLVVGEGADHAGIPDVVDIGLGLYGTVGQTSVLDADDVATCLPTPNQHADKYSRGVVGVVTGGSQYPGAAVLSTGGAVRAGAGYVRYGGPAIAAVSARWPTVVAGQGRVDAMVIGSGLGTEDAVLQRVRQVLSTTIPAVVDADALAIGPDLLRARPVPTLITPHAGEFERLTGVDPAGDPLGAARNAASDLGVTVLLKGQHTVVAAPDGRARINPTGSTWLSTAGSGDVLAGAAGALLAAFVKRGMDPVDLAFEAGSIAAFLHGLAAHQAAQGAAFAADALLDSWSEAVRSVRAA